MRYGERGGWPGWRCCGPPGWRGPSPSRPGEEVAPLARPAAAQPGPGGGRQPAALGGARLLADAHRPVLHRRPLRPAGRRRAGLAPGGRRPGRAAPDPHAWTTCGPARARRSSSPWSAPATTASPGSRRRSAPPAGRARRWPRCCGGGRAGPRAARWSSGAPTPARRTVREITMPQHFARSMSLADALDPEQPAVLRDERRAAAAGPRVPAAADRPRLVRGGQRQVADPHRGAGHPPDEPLHGPRLRHHPRGRRATGGTVWTETSVGRARLKSVPAKVTRAGRAVPHRRRGLGRAHRAGGGADRRRAVAAGDDRPQRGGATSPGGSGRWTGARRRRGSTPSPRGPSTPRGTSSRRRTTPGSPASGPTGRATARSRAASASRSAAPVNSLPVTSCSSSSAARTRFTLRRAARDPVTAFGWGCVVPLGNGAPGHRCAAPSDDPQGL